MSHFYPDIHEARIREVHSRLAKEIVVERTPLEAQVSVTREPVPWARRAEQPGRRIALGETWGEKFDCGWFHVTGSVPREWKGGCVTLNLDFGGEALVFDAKGCPVVGLTKGSVFDAHYNKDHFHWLEKAVGGEAVDFWIDVGANGLFGLTRPGDPAWEPTPPEDIHGTWKASVNALSACLFDRDKWQLMLDLEVLLSLSRALPEHSSRRIQVLRATSRALDALPPERGGAAAVRDELKRTVWAVGVDPAAVKVSAIGHAHIDVEWLWPLRETIRKTARTFSSQIGLIERYPGYKFGASQAQLYALCREHYPALYEKVKQAVAAGAWEIQGGMWVEADCNIPSGESLVRQFLTGMRFFRDDFGVVPRNLWLPDVFGYSGNLPQILRACGIGFFLTQKLSWNRYNTFPHNSFVWEGIDGSRVVAHFPPEDTYNAAMLPEELKKHETNNREAGIVDVALSLFGIGDGGGGPKEEYVERAIRCASLNGCPPVAFRFAQEAMDEIAKCEPDLDGWRGELYFEMHRGTYTTQAAQKLANRRAEEALRAAEMLCATAAAGGRGRPPYPHAELDALWKALLLCQFHDIIPGSSIHRVYEESGELVRGVEKKARALASRAAEALLSPDSGALTLFNPSSTPFRGAIRLPEGWTSAECAAADLPARPVAVQGDGRGGVLALVEVPPRAFATLRRPAAAGIGVETVPAREEPVASPAPIVLENDRVRYEIDPSTLHLVRATDKECHRDFVLPDAPGNALRLYEDHPSSYDAWDVEEYALAMPVAEPVVESAATFSGPVASGIRATLRIGDSSLVQTLSLEAGSKRLDFDVECDWRENHKLLRVAFPLDVKADEARFEIQYGTVARATNDNTKWQYAQFESCAHRYADLSDPDFGVSLLNDSKYGYRAKGSELSLSLLRAPTEPDPIADRGHHHFRYALLPHAGDLAHSDETCVAAAILNQGVERLPGLAAENGGESRPALPVALEGDGAELAVLKKAEDSDALIVRIVERRGRRATARLSAPGLPAGALATPCLATELADLGAPVALPATIPLRPFEIKTLRIEKPRENRS